MKLSFDLKSKLQDYLRVLKAAKKPNKKEFNKVLRITGMGTILIGIIGFVFYLIFSLIG